MWLTFKQIGLQGGQELPVKISQLNGASVLTDESDEQGEITFRKIGLRLSGSDDVRCTAPQIYLVDVWLQHGVCYAGKRVYSRDSGLRRP